MNARHALLPVALVAALGLAACHHDEAPKADTQAIAAAQAALSSPAWMRQHLPAQTVAYLRIPSVWGLLGAAPSGRPLDAAMASQAHLDAVAKIRTGIANDKLLGSTPAAAILLSLLDELRSPVEAALIDPLGIPSPASRVVVTAQLSFTDLTRLKARLETIGPVLAGPIDAKGNAQLVGGGALHYDLATRRLYITQSKQEPSDAASLAALINTLNSATAATGPASLSSLEARVDTSGQGLFGWASIRGMGGLASGNIPDSVFGKLPADFATKADAVALGWGTVDGHGQFRILIHAPGSRALDYLAPRSFAPKIHTAGKPHWAFTMALPDATAWQTMTGNLTLDFGSEGAVKYTKLQKEMQDRIGYDLNDIAQWFGPELVAWSDNSGTFSAVRVRDRKAVRARIEQMVATRRWKTGTARVSGTEVHWLTIPAIDANPKDASPGSMEMAKLLARFNSHLWWVDDGDFMIMATVPQALADRDNVPLDGSLDEWFTSKHYAGTQTLMGFLATSRDAQRDAYYQYLQVLQVMGDASGQPVDIATMPAANTLHLPRDGIVGAALEADKDTLAVSLTYEQSPAELVGQAGGTTGIATAAIMIAIAVPQYQTYVKRSQVAEGISAVTEVKEAVAAQRLKTGKFPGSNKAAGLGAPETLTSQYLGRIEVMQGGEIVATFDSTQPGHAYEDLNAAEVVFSPQVSSGKVTWTCSSADIKDKLLPADCRDAPLAP
ncbi:hypothetical protein FHW69_003398 [Luteibacter sp. Sphag1AF]|uniref:pilin n=1 Tax=Luteibacter sp. Sphag1AF TaxID=2587031 RepID=UPI001618AA10|nr:pilin [Luteibacter sp. Sphag1AF]MBB3228756.1 hypothetical protein [Luteibacter sp. Sphag1AF]